MNYKNLEFTEAFPLRPGAYAGQILDCYKKTIKTRFGKKDVWQFDLMLKTKVGYIRTSTLEFVEDSFLYNQLCDNLYKTYGEDFNIADHIGWMVTVYLDASYHMDNKYYLHVVHYLPDDVTLLMTKEELEKLESFDDE